MAQGYIVDQQSTNTIEGAAGIQSNVPMGQSFTPSVNSIGYISLNLYDGDPFHSAGGTVYVNLRSGSITGLILGTTASVFMPDNFFGTTNFIFSSTVALIPGVKYYIEPVALPGSDGWGALVSDGSYGGGSLFQSGVPVAGRNLWFQEGVIVVPEPSGAGLISLSGLVWLFVQRKKRRLD